MPIDPLSPQGQLNAALRIARRRGGALTMGGKLRPQPGIADPQLQAAAMARAEGLTLEIADPEITRSALRGSGTFSEAQRRGGVQWKGTGEEYTWAERPPYVQRSRPSAPVSTASGGGGVITRAAAPVSMQKLGQEFSEVAQQLEGVAGRLGRVSRVLRGAATPQSAPRTYQDIAMARRAEGSRGHRRPMTGGRQAPIDFVGSPEGVTWGGVEPTPVPQSWTHSRQVTSGGSRAAYTRGRTHSSGTNPTLVTRRQRVAQRVASRQQRLARRAAGRVHSGGVPTVGPGWGPFSGMKYYGKPSMFGLGSLAAFGAGAAIGGGYGGAEGAVLGGLAGIAATKVPWLSMAWGGAKLAGTGLAMGFEGAAGTIGMAARTGGAGNAFLGRVGIGAAIGGALGGLPGAGVGAAFGALPTRKMFGGVAKGAGRRTAAFAARKPGLFGLALGAALAVPAMMRGLGGMAAPNPAPMPDFAMGNSNLQYGMDPNNMNTQGLALALHYRR